MAAPRYRVVLTDDVKVVLRLLIQRALVVGALDRVDAALRLIEKELADRPNEWGDPHRHYPNAQLTTYLRVFDELAVTYAVHATRPVLWVTDIVPVLGHPLRS